MKELKEIINSIEEAGTYPYKGSSDQQKMARLQCVIDEKYPVERVSIDCETYFGRLRVQFHLLSISSNFVIWCKSFDGVIALLQLLKTDGDISDIESGRMARALDA